MIALHGFLGLSSDWSSFAGFEGRDLWKDISPFDEWAKNFTAKFPAGEWLLGYSMGGRLAMHAALHAPEKIGGLILVSANPGVVPNRDERLASDREWASRFRSAEPWTELVPAWNAQPVLKSSSNEFMRNESDFDREALAAALEIWSLAKQKDLREELLSLEIPVLYLTGSKDVKFTQMMSSLELPPSQVHNEVEGAGHRVPWEKPSEFVSAIEEFRSFFG